MTRPLLVHVTTTDISLALLLGPQLVAFRDAGYDVVGVSAPGPFVARLEADQIRHIALRHGTRAMSPVHDAAALGELWSMFRTLRPDIVHTHNPKPGVYGRMAARAAGVGGVVNTVHGLYATPEDSFMRRGAVYGLERLAGACGDVDLVQNEEDLEVLTRLGVPSRKMRLLGNGIDLARFDPRALRASDRAGARAELGAGDGDVVVGAVGRLVREKGYPELFEAARTVSVRYPHGRFVVVGPSDVDKSDALSEAELAAAERDAGVRFLGLRDDMARLYAAMDIFVLASHREGFPRAAMEAAAMGLPVIATNVRGCRQVVEDGVSGVLVPLMDARALAEAIAELVTDPTARARMGAAGHAKARKQFDQDDVIRITLETYDALMCRRSGRRLNAFRRRRRATPRGQDV